MALWQLRAKGVVNGADKSGRLVTYQPGDWFKVGKQKAIELLESGQAELPGYAEGQTALKADLKDCGILVLNGTIKQARTAAGKHKLSVRESAGGLELPWPRTLIWNANRELSSKQIALGFVRVEDTGRYSSWEMAAMLRGRDLLAKDTGSPADQQGTREIAGDLRLSVYDVSAVWARKTTKSDAMVAAWGAELEAGTGPEHAFLRALYTNRVLFCTLAAGWLRGLR